MSITQQLIHTAHDFGRKADVAIINDNYAEAYAMYFMAHKYYKEAVEKDTSGIKEAIQHYVDYYYEKLSKFTLEFNNNGASNTSAKQAQTNCGQTGSSSDGDEIAKFKASIIPQNLDPTFTMGSISGFKELKEELGDFVDWCSEELIPGEKTTRGIVLHGPPGMGKTCFAKALANTANMTLFNVSPSKLLSKWIGVSEQRVDVLFEVAHQHSPAIIFIDEAEALCESRESDSSRSGLRILNEMLMQIDGIVQRDGKILVVIATNFPWKLDEAFLDRLSDVYYISPPDKDARKRLFELELKKYWSRLSPIELDLLAQNSDRLSGRRIGKVVENAKSRLKRKCKLATHCVLLDKDIDDIPSEDYHKKYMPCMPNYDRAVEMKWDQIPEDQRIAGPLLMYDLDIALQLVLSKKVDPKQIKKYEDFDKKFGKKLYTFSST